MLKNQPPGKMTEGSSTHAVVEDRDSRVAFFEQ
jgi:hypothetical protein